MSDPITAAAIVSFSERLQDASARFYRALGAAFPARREGLEEYARRCERDKTQIARTYRETVTDALETNFSFEGIALPPGLLDVSVPEGGDWAAVMARAAQLEQGAAAFYEDVAAKSESLLATIPRAYQRVAARRREQADAWRALLAGS